MYPLLLFSAHSLASTWTKGQVAYGGIVCFSFLFFHSELFGAWVLHGIGGKSLARGFFYEIMSLRFTKKMSQQAAYEIEPDSIKNQIKMENHSKNTLDL